MLSAISKKPYWDYERFAGCVTSNLIRFQNFSDLDMFLSLSRRWLKKKLIENAQKISLHLAIPLSKVSPCSGERLVIATHLGYYRHKRLPLGIYVAPSLFQRHVDKIHGDSKHVSMLSIDIFITESSHL
ncbi:hypothetical protein RF11_13680 [Thelohanellus kitauei]|uniref:Uncharacterized protein n=1 Tax=Thelohanellus kitauei TaxID=669202 RepID=A0A0C2MKU5_THEKT|nr:hypothetical protein RF11_13680 [Thelohanellus kitauei]